MNLGETLSRAGALDQALSLACEALALAREHGQRGVEGWGLRLLAEIAAHRDPPSLTESEDYYRQARGLAADLGMQPLVARCHLGLGELYKRSRSLEKALAQLTAAAGLFRSIEMTFWLAQAEAELRTL
jgi:tetratricopeptide (TPR) repeat protein